MPPGSALPRYSIRPTMKKTPPRSGRKQNSPIIPSTKRNQKRLLASRANSRHGRLTSAWFRATQCRNMNFPRLLSHVSSSPHTSPTTSRTIAAGTIQ